MYDSIKRRVGLVKVKPRSEWAALREPQPISRSGKACYKPGFYDGSRRALAVQDAKGVARA